MWRETARRFFVLVLSVALATGLVVRSVQAGVMGASATAMHNEMPMSGKCDGCAGGEMTPAACSVFCAGMVALAPIALSFDPVPGDVVVLSSGPFAADHCFPPDPYPPRPSVLS